MQLEFNLWLSANVRVPHIEKYLSSIDLVKQHLFLNYLQSGKLVEMIYFCILVKQAIVVIKV